MSRRAKARINATPERGAAERLGAPRRSEAGSTIMRAFVLAVAVFLGLAAFAGDAGAQVQVFEMGPDGRMVPVQNPGQPGAAPTARPGQPTAQPGQAVPPAANRGGTINPQDPRTFPVNPTPPSKGRALVFWVFALICVGTALLVITRRNLVSAVMLLVGTFLAIAGLYATLYAHFLAVIQVLVYAGAIMVLFVFVIMILNKEEEEPWALRGLIGKGVAGLALLYLVVRLGGILWDVRKRLPETATWTPDFGTTKSIGSTLFSSYLFPFEFVSIVLLIAVVGGLVIAHPGHPSLGTEAGANPDKGVGPDDHGAHS